MKLVAWNVNGIRAILKKDFEKSLNALDPDIISLGEIKLTEGMQFPIIPEGYECFYTVSKVKKGYSGVAVLSRLHPKSIWFGLENKEYDDEGRIITLEFNNFYYVAVYSPNSQDGLLRLPYRVEYEKKLREYLVKLSKSKSVILAGDLNVAHNPIDIKNAKANEGCSGYTIEERTCFSELLDSGFTDAYRYLYPEKVEYSWWSYRFNARERNAGWRIDYFVISNDLREKLINSTIHTDIYGSDHCPISIEIKL